MQHTQDDACSIESAQKILPAIITFPINTVLDKKFLNF